MRKQYKTKLRSCKLCKPHKMGWEHRFKPQEEQKRRIMEQEKQDPDKGLYILGYDPF